VLSPAEASVAAAQRIADEVLYPAAGRIDSAPVVPRSYLDALAEAGLYDLPGDPVAAARVVESLGGASLVTAFVWIQHHSPVRALATAGGELAAEWLAPLRAGRVRAGTAYAALRRPGPPAATARPAPGGGWLLSGHAPWVTGWGLIDVVLAGARYRDDVVWLLLDASQPTSPPGTAVSVEGGAAVSVEGGAAVSVEPVRLDALDASATVRLRWDSFPVPDSRVVAVEPLADWRRRDASGRALNGYLAVGVAARAARLLDSSRLTAAVGSVRAGLDHSTPDTVVRARAEASLLAVRAAVAVVAAGGGRSVEAGATAARLMREAMFLLVFGQSSDIRALQVEALGA
jgi:alkylation response protein AidB-like acyl-CoA dehydrogenase